MKSLKAYEKIRDMILTGKKLPGTRLILSDLETELGIGRGPIREAIMRLDRSGLVKNIPYKGAIVATPPTRTEVLHIYDLRMDLEGRLALAALEHITPEDIQALEALDKTMQDLPMDHYRHDREFHQTLYNAAHMPHLANIAATMIFTVEGVLNIYHREKEHCRTFNEEHGKIIQAIKNHDPDQLLIHVHENIKSGLTIIEETFRKLVHLPQ
ncbi:MAG: GntR family transcriptional regulator [Desulfobacterales bacterium]|nr:GntR family transcriptional regulator [Desulfobacterales bacterium]